MRHGLTLGELGRWFIDHFKLDVNYRVIEMTGYEPDAPPGHGWPLGERVWVNPSPNAPNLWMARAYAGTVMLEGTTLSEGRGTTRPLELFGAPDIDAAAILAEMRRLAPHWLEGCAVAKPPSSRPSTSMSASSATASTSMPRRRSTTTQPSSRGGCSRSPSRRSAGFTPAMICGAISRTNMRSASCRST
jgi:hypothetical protein